MGKVANTILEQLGGKRFKAMTGASRFMALDNGLRFSLPLRLAKDGINKIDIDLTPWDLYNIKFYRIGPAPEYKVKTIFEAHNIYVEDLRKIISEHTGLALTLGGPELVGAGKFPRVEKCSSAGHKGGQPSPRIGGSRS